MKNPLIKICGITSEEEIRYIAKAVIATNIGQFNIFCNTIDNKIVATGSAKNNNKLFIIFHPFLGKFFLLLL